MPKALKRSSKLPATHPGQIIKHDILEAEGMSAQQLAICLGVSRQTVQRLIASKNPASVSVSMALKLEKCLSISAQTWLNLQSKYDLWLAEKEGSDVQDVKPLRELVIQSA